MTGHKKKAALFSALLIIFLPASCGSNSSSIAVTEWSALYSGSQSFETVLQEESWVPVSDISKIKLPQQSEDELHHIWLRGIFYINDNPADYYGLSSGSIRFTDKTYINKSLIGSLPLEQVNWNPKPRNYRIQENILKKGKNEIYIELGIYGNEPGGISEDVLIQAKNDFNRASFVTGLVYNQFPFAIMFLYVSLSIQLFLFYLFWEKREKHYLYTSMSLLLAAVYTAMFLPLYILLDFRLSHSIKFSCIIIITIFVMLNYQALYRIYLSGFNRIVVPVLLGMVLLLHVLSYKFYSPLTIELVLAFTFIIIASAFSFLLYRLNSINKLNQKKTDNFIRNMIVASLTVFGLIVILESYSFITGGFYPGFISIFVPPILMIFYDTIVSRESKNRRLELELLYRKLKKDSTCGEHNQTDALHGGIASLTDNSERKLKKVIEFIDENYISDLSREGLAAAVDMHPNYMGRLFKIYTGRSINEYINHLRVDDAIKQLESANTKVIDIAFSLGFESITTFNRNFKKETGKTPSEYKKSG